MSDPWGWLPVTRDQLRRYVADAIADAKGHAAALLAHHDTQLRRRLAELERIHTAHVQTTDIALTRLEGRIAELERVVRAPGEPAE